MEAACVRLPADGTARVAGPGDLKILAERGFRSIGIDRSRPLLTIALEHSGRSEARSDFRRIGLESDSFEGVWAIATLLNIPRREVGSALAEIRRVLRPSGVFFSTMQRGEGHRVLADGRYFEFY